MKEKLTHDEVNTLIKASQLAREKGIKLGVNVKEICQQAGISRKTGYQWLKEEQESNRKKEEKFDVFFHNFCRFYSINFLPFPSI